MGKCGDALAELPLVRVQARGGGLACGVCLVPPVPTSRWHGGRRRTFFEPCARRFCPAWRGYAPPLGALEACHARTAHC